MQPAKNSNSPEHAKMANAIRVLAMDAVQKANSGHPGMPMGMADAATVLFAKHLKFDAQKPDWPDRDRFILSAGHGSMLLYALLHLAGYSDMTIEEIKNFRQLGSKTPGHPEHGHTSGVETTTGPLGQGLANSVGFAIAEERLRAEYGKEAVDHRTYVIAGDGCLMEGVSQEAISLAGHQRLGKLIVLWDNNSISIDGEISLADSTSQVERFIASGWNTIECHGHSETEIDQAIEEAKSSSKPTLIACKTHIGYGSPNKQDTAKAHGAPLGEEEIALTRAAYGWEHPPFHIPQDILEKWREAGRRGGDERKAWEARIQSAAPQARGLMQALKGEIPEDLAGRISEFKRKVSEEQPKIATRQASQRVLEIINAACPEIMGGSADLTGSNNTLTEGMETFSPERRTGQYMHYGIREHAMAAIMNGMALHGGIRPYGGTFLCFTDYARPAMRLSALMGLSVIYVMTHDSIGLGEDGPTHQPVEHLAMLRATPNMNVFRPADAVETAEAWLEALRSKGAPSVMVLGRQAVSTVRTAPDPDSLASRGAYIIKESPIPEKAALIATGSEVELAIAAQEILAREQVGVRVVSMPCQELFERQSPEYQKETIPPSLPRVIIEAGVRFGWDKWLGGDGEDSPRGAFVGMDGFGASAPAKDLYVHFGLTPEAIAERAKGLAKQSMKP